MNNLKRRTAAGLGAMVLGVVLAGAGAGSASAADDDFQDYGVQCADQVCAHVQYTQTGEHLQVRAVGTAPAGQSVSIVKVTLDETAYPNKVPVPPSSYQQAVTDQVVTSGGQQIATTAGVQWYCLWMNGVDHSATVQYRVNGGALKTVSATVSDYTPHNCTWS
ncbi:hypothetical protein ACIHFE_17375 [Streptomyces sp. NPDC052396]|uniref:hypothetical protein n=1 Tax=Streptomyces sp. NPDC052396 TaxID=3365689 RepID=UPI0037D24875